VTSFDTPGHVALRVTVPGGEVTIDTGDEPRVEIELVALRDNDATHQLIAETRVEKVDRGGTHEILVEAPKRAGSFIGRGPKIGVRIRCPHESDLVLRSSSADLAVRGALGAVEVKSASGDVSLQDVASLDAATASGDTEVRDVAGVLTVKTASGDVSVRRCSGALSVNLVSGDLLVAEASAGFSVNTVSGDVEVRAAGGGDMRVQAVSGDVHIGVKPGERLYIDASSVSGTMSSELDLEESPSVEGPAVALRARTVSGDVQITRAAAVGA
jgi:DUF4097 and DUF4098 domain-containing protein YvlB